MKFYITSGSDFALWNIVTDQFTWAFRKTNLLGVVGKVTLFGMQGSANNIIKNNVNT